MSGTVGCFQCSQGAGFTHAVVNPQGSRSQKCDSWTLWEGGVCETLWDL